MEKDLKDIALHEKLLTAAELHVCRVYHPILKILAGRVKIKNEMCENPAMHFRGPGIGFNCYSRLNGDDQKNAVLGKPHRRIIWAYLGSAQIGFSDGDGDGDGESPVMDMERSSQ